MSSDETGFLRNQVERLNSLLLKYQEKYPLPEKKVDSDLVSLPPWLTDHSLLSPVMVEYDNIIHTQEETITQQKREIQELQRRVKEVLSENARLLGELRDSVESQIPSEVAAAPLAPGQDTTHDQQLLHNFELQLDLAAQEKESAEGKWRTAVQEIDRLEKELEAEKESHQWRVVEQQAHQVKDQYMQSVAALNQEIETLNSDLRQARSEVNLSEQQVKELKSRLAELQTQVTWKNQEQVDVMFKEGITDSKLMDLQQVRDSLQHKLSISQREAEELKRENISMETRVTELQKKVLELEENETDTIMRVRDAVQMVENAVLEKDQAELQCQQKDQEIDEMQDVINKLINEAGLRTRQEVDSVKRQSNDRISKLTEEVHTLEMELSEKQSQVERLLREKRSVESELEKIYKDGMIHGSKQHGAFEDMNQRAIGAERRRDELELKLDSLESSLKREQLNCEQLQAKFDRQLEKTSERSLATQLELDNVMEDRMRCLDEIDDLKRKLQCAQQDKEAAQRKFLKQSALLEQDQQLKLRDYEVKLQSTEDVNRQAMVELRRLLGAQQRMSARWKEECKTITEKFEVKVKELRLEVSQLKHRIEELTALLRESQEKHSETERVIGEYTKNVHRMEERVREAEQRAADANRKLSRHVVRERQMVNERQSLLQELGQSARSPREQGLLSSPRSNGHDRMEDRHVGHMAHATRQQSLADNDDILSER